MDKLLKVEKKVQLELQDKDEYNFTIQLNMDDAHELYNQLGEQLGVNQVKSDEQPRVELVPQEIKKVESDRLKVEDFKGYTASGTSDLGMNIINNVTNDIYAEFRTFLKENDAYDKYLKNRFDPKVNINFRSVILFAKEYIWEAFNLTKTPEGSGFWSELDDKWRDHLRSLQE